MKSSNKREKGVTKIIIFMKLGLIGTFRTLSSVIVSKQDFDLPGLVSCIFMYKHRI